MSPLIDPSGLLRPFRREPKPAPSLPDGVLLYAVGDIHGRRDLLEGLLSEIRKDAEPIKAKRRMLLFVGDYIDRGADSCGVIGIVSAPIPPFDTVCLKGNHEQVLLEFLADPSMWRQWREFGGGETMASYGVNTKLLTEEPDDPVRIRDAFLAALPDRHYDFLRGLKVFYECGDYYFVHAGLRPGVPLSRQVETDQLWIRDKFFSAGNAFEGRVIVHGHTPRSAPEHKPYRIGLDTGAYASGCLTAARLLGPDVTFLQYSL